MKLILVAAVALAPLLAENPEPAQRSAAAGVVFSEVMEAPDLGISQDLFERARCIAIVPDVKTGTPIIGGKYSTGYLSCKNVVGPGWSAPGAIRIEGGSFGIQTDGFSTDLIMLAMNAKGTDKLLSDKFTLGAEGSVAAGPVGRIATAQTDALMHADILAWSRSQGLFAGIALDGTTLMRQDLDGNAAIYGSRLLNRDIVTRRRPVPAVASKLIDLLNKYSARPATSASLP